MTADTIEQLIHEHKEHIAARLRELQRLLATFSLEVHNSAQPQPGELPVGPITVYRATFEPRDDDPQKTSIVRFKALDAAASRLAAADALGKIEYELEEKKNRSVQCYGVMGVPLRLILDAQRINQAKDALKEAIKPVSKHQVRIPGENTKRQLVRVILRQLQSSSVNLQAAYRKIPLIDEPVKQIRLMNIRTRTVANRTVQSLRDELSEAPSAKGRADIDRLSALPPTEYLAHPTDHYERVRAKVLLQRTKFIPKRPSVKAPVRIDLPAELPLLFPMTPASVPPQIIAPTPWQPNDTDFVPPQRLEPAPIVESLGYYRLLPEYRRYRDENGNKVRTPPSERKASAR